MSYVVELEPGVWVAGDPGRTLERKNAQVFETKVDASVALIEARKYLPFEDARIRVADREILNRWAENRHHHGVIIEFLNWVESKHSIRLEYDPYSTNNPAPLDRQKLVDEFFEIDREQLEAERRETLRELRR